MEMERLEAEIKDLSQRVSKLEARTKAMAGRSRNRGLPIVHPIIKLPRDRQHTGNLPMAWTRDDRVPIGRGL